MWAFLQTFERYRAILNYYDKLEGRGDTTTTSQMSVRRANYSTITSGEEADAFVKERDGYLGEALRSARLLYPRRFGNDQAGPRNHRQSKGGRISD